jgi:two-component system nitrate/nitrite response regulator NarL
MKESINLYLADDHQIVIDGLSLLLKNEKNICIIGSATNGLTAYNDIINLKPIVPNELLNNGVCVFWCLV